VIGVTYAQPLLVNRVVSFLGQPETSTSKGIGSGLIGAYAIVYMGIAVSIKHHELLLTLLVIQISLTSTLS
jgi:hypothetical protein